MNVVGIIVVFIIIVVAAVIIYYSLTEGVNLQFPASIFEYNDIITIQPVMLTKNGLVTNTNQYFQKLSTGDNLCINTTNNSVNGYNDMGLNACVGLFNGNGVDPQNKWILKQFEAGGGGDSETSIIYGYGNRFYLQNLTFTDPTVRAGRLMYQPVNRFSGTINYVNSCPFTTATTIGFNKDVGGSEGYNVEMLIYFMPTAHKDIYYMLFPSCIDKNYHNNEKPNDGIISVRPWANNLNTWQLGNGCNVCTTFSATYDPFNKDELYPNCMITNKLPNNGNVNTAIPPFNYSNIVLFEIKKVGSVSGS